jgi:hypothetical protein
MGYGHGPLALAVAVAIAIAMGYGRHCFTYRESLELELTAPQHTAVKI